MLCIVGIPKMIDVSQNSAYTAIECFSVPRFS